MSELTQYRIRRKTFTVVREGSREPAIRVIQTGRDAAAYLLPFLRAADAGREHFAVAFLNGRNRAIAGKILFSGQTNETAVFPREICRQALLMNASAVICAHNHPSGDTSPSREDIAVSRRIQAALSTLDLKLVDSIVINDAGDYRSIPFNCRG